MAEGDAPVYHTETHSNTGKWILIVLAVLYVAGSGYLMFDQRSKLDKIGQDDAASQKQLADLNKRRARDTSAISSAPGGGLPVRR